MKKIVSCSLLFALFLSSQAQTRIAIIGGVHSSTIKEDQSTDNYKSRIGLHAGALLDVPISSSFSFQPSAMFTNKGRKFETDSLKAWQYVNYIDVPLNLVFKMPMGGSSKFILGAGPYVSFLISGKEKSEATINGQMVTTENQNLTRGSGTGEYKGFNYGWNALAGVEFSRFFITANYSHGLNDFYQPANHSGSYRHQTIGATVGIFLNRGTPKIKDRDKDGVIDAEDECPDEPGMAVTKGCPDRDGDGIADKNDNCPDVAGLAKYHGCPIPDTDKDGVNDEEDKCPTVAGLAKYNGCPIPDTDNDGINDEEDKCPSVAGVAKYNGCPIPDTDNDGVNDEEDKCPTVAGTKENNGCPELNEKLVDKVSTDARSIQFKSNKAELTPQSQKKLDEVADIMQQNPELKLSISAHTSTGGNDEANMKISQDRADAVKAYLESKGIASDRLQAQGFGSTQPISSGKTAAEKAKNKRIELKLSNQ